MVELSQSHYGHFIVLKCLEYSTPELRNQLIDEFTGFYSKLLRHRVISEYFPNSVIRKQQELLNTYMDNMRTHYKERIYFLSSMALIFSFYLRFLPQLPF